MILVLLLLVVKSPAGTYVDNGQVVACPRGHYQSETGQTSCLVCPDDFTTEGVESRDKGDCSGVL